MRGHPSKHLSNLILVARIISSNNLPLAGKLIREHPFFEQRLSFDAGRVQLVEPVTFAQEVREGMANRHARTIQVETSRPERLRNSSKISAATRLAKLWRSLAPVQSLPAILCLDGSIARTESDKACELGGVWGCTFSNIEDIPPEGLQFLQSVAPWPLSDIAPALTTDFCRHIFSLKDSATGPDMLPARILKECCLQLAGPLRMLAQSILHFGAWPRSWMVH